jgi:hypothetical protein
MATPDWNEKQALIRAFDAIKNAFRVLVMNDLSNPVPVVITSGGSFDTTPTIFNVPCAVAGQEYSQALPANCRRFIMKARKNSKVDFAYVTAATEVLTLNSGFSFEDNSTYLNGTLYFKCSKADEIVEIVAYV